VVAQQAQDTFVITLGDGADHFVAKGQVLPDGHAVVKAAPKLFAKFDADGADEKPPAKSEPAKPAAAPKAEAKPPVKDEGKPPAGKASGRG
jgi:hypothetical protein